MSVIPWRFACVRTERSAATHISAAEERAGITDTHITHN